MKRSLPRWGRLVAGGASPPRPSRLASSSTSPTAWKPALASGITFGLADIGKMSIPVVAGVVGWSGQLRATAVVCVAVSLWCAVNYYADHHGRDLLAKSWSLNLCRQRQGDRRDGGRAASLRSLAQQEATRGGCKQACRAIMAQAESAAQRLQEACTAKVALKPVEISGLAVMVAMATGSQPESIARGIGAVKAALFLALVEVLVWLSVPAMMLLHDATRVATGERPRAGCWCGGCETCCRRCNPGHCKSAPATAKQLPPPAKAGRGSRAYYLHRLEREAPRLAREVADGTLSVFAAAVAAGWRKPSLQLA